MSIAVIPNRTNDYPTADGRPMAETDWHRDLMMDLIQTLQAFYAHEDRVYISGNLLVFYARGDRRRHLSPDVFVVKGVAKHARGNYLIWEEGRGPDIVIEITSPSTQDEDLKQKMTIYRDVLKVPEYFLFDPKLEYLDPPLQGFRLQDGQYVPIEPLDGRLPSEVLGLHLEQDGQTLRLYNPATGERLPNEAERNDAAEQAREQAQEAKRAVETYRREAETARRETLESRQERESLAAEIDRLRRELDQARQSPPTPPAAGGGP